MYKRQFGLTQSPFRITPDTRLFYWGGDRGVTLDALVYAIDAGEGIIKVVGEVGSGKTILCRKLIERLPEEVEAVYLLNPRVESDRVLYAVMAELGLETRGMDRDQAIQTMHDYLMARHAQGRRVIVLLEEAQKVSLEALEEIRLLSNLETRHEKLLQIVLFGQPELDDKLSQYAIRPLRERITSSFSLRPFDRKEIEQYVNARLAACGRTGESPFTPAALRIIHRASRGLVRRVNILAHKSLLAAFAEGGSRVTAALARAAVRDSEFDPLWKRLLGRAEEIFLRPLSGAAAILAVASALIFAAPSFSYGGLGVPALPTFDAGGWRIPGFSEVIRKTASAATALFRSVESHVNNPSVAEPAAPTAAAEPLRLPGQSTFAWNADPLVPVKPAPAWSSSLLQTAPAFEPAPEPESVDAEPEIEKTADAEPKVADDEPEVADAEPVVVEVAPPPAEKAEAAPTSIKKAEASPTPIKKAEAAPPAPKPIDGAFISDRIARSHDWLETRKEEGYSLQLMAASSPVTIERFLKSWDERATGMTLDQLHIFRMPNGALLVNANLYDAMEEALTALRALPAPLQKQGAFVRVLSGVKKGLDLPVGRG